MKPSLKQVYKKYTAIFPKRYLRETSISLKIRIYDYCRVLKMDDKLISLINQRNENNHNIDLDNACLLKKVQNKSKHLCLEFTLIL